jgi:hypothetical protein
LPPVELKACGVPLALTSHLASVGAAVDDDADVHAPERSVAHTSAAEIHVSGSDLT